MLCGGGRKTQGLEDIERDRAEKHRQMEYRHMELDVYIFREIGREK